MRTHNFAFAAFSLFYFACLQTTVSAEIFHDFTTDQRIVNSSDTYSGTTTVSTSVTSRQGAIQVDTEGVTTTIEGTLRVTSNTPESTTQYPIGIYALNGGAVDIKTISDTDRVFVDVYGPVGVGIRAINKGIVNMDVSSYGGEGAGAVINILKSSSADKTEEAAALEATSNGIINARGNFELNAVQDRGYGIWTAGTDAALTISGNAKINTKGAGGYGIRADGGSIKITGDFDIVTESTGYSSGTLSRYYSYGIQARNGATVEVGGKTTISTVGQVAFGLLVTSNDANSLILLTSDAEITTSGANASAIAFSGSNYFLSPSGSGAGTITVAKSAVLTTRGASAHGVQVNGDSAGATVNLNGATSINLSGNTAYGLYTGSATSTINVTDATLAITSAGSGAAHAIFASNGNINLSGIKSISLAGSGNALRAASGGKITGSEAKYTFGGTIYSTGNNSAVSLSMADSSYYKGQTQAVSSGKIDLKFKGGSTWETLAVTSTLTSAGFEDSSKLIMTIGSADAYSKLSLANFSLDSTSTIKVILDDFAPELDAEFQLVLAAEGIAFEGSWDFEDAKLADPDWYWDTSKFNDTGVIRVAAVPEASTLALFFGIAAFGIAAASRRKR